MIPREIEIEHVEQAARSIAEKGIPPSRGSRQFDVIVSGKPYPPKYLLSVATRLATGKELSAWSFITTEARHFLTRRDFKVVEKRKRNHQIEVPIVVATPSFVIRWDDIDCRDVIPLSWLANGRNLTGVEHEMRDRSARLQGKARCDAVVESKTARLDYRPYRNFNRKSEVEFGETRVSFSSEPSLIVGNIEWRSEDLPQQVIQGEAEECILQQRPVRRYVRPKKSAQKISALRRERPGQRRFREALEFAYGNCCCISGCGVSNALEGAHIDPYESPASDHTCNGLLLRKDIHALFDAHLISADPQTHLIVIAPQLSHTEYAKFKGKRLSPPTDSSDATDEVALTRHMHAFKKRNS